MRKFFICVFVFLLVVPVISTADTKVGLSPAVVMFSIDDPDGDTEDYVGFQPFGITTVHDLNNKYRVMAVFNYFDFEAASPPDRSRSNLLRTSNQNGAPSETQSVEARIPAIFSSHPRGSPGTERGSPAREVHPMGRGRCRSGCQCQRP